MSFKATQVFPHLLPTGKTIPDGWTGNTDISVEWVGRIVLDLNSERYDGVIFKKDDKQVYIPWNEIATRLGIEW